MLSAILTKIRSALGKNPIDSIKLNQTLRSSWNMVGTEVVERILAAASSVGFPLYSLEENKVYIWSGTVFEEVEMGDIRTFLSSCSEDLGLLHLIAFSTNYQKHIYDQLVGSDFERFYAVTMDEMMEQLIVDTRNKRLIINKVEIEAVDLTPSMLPTTVIYADYDPTATCPLFESLLSRSMPDNKTRDAFFEYLGLCLIPFGHQLEPNLQKCMVMVGPRDTGKSVIVKVIQALFGSRQTTLERLSDLCLPPTKENFHLANLEGKHLCICNDVENRIPSLETFKSLVSGEGARANRKHKEMLELTHYARLLVVGNAFPTVKASDPAILKRILPIPMENSIDESEQRTDLANVIIESELPGIFNKVLEGLVRLLENMAFSESEDMLMKLKEYEFGSFHLPEFLRDNGYHPVEKGKTFQNVLFKEYKEYCGQRKYSDALQSLQAFGKAMARLGYISFRPKGKIAYRIDKNEEDPETA